MISQRLVVPQQARGLPGGGQEAVEIAIAVEVGVGGPAPNHGLRERRASLRGVELLQFRPPRGTGVPVELRRLLVLLALLHLRNVVFEMPIRYQQVESRVEIDVEKTDPELQPDPRGGAQPRGDRVVREEHPPPLGTVQGGHLVGEIANHHREGFVVSKPAHVTPHGSPRLAIVVDPQATFETHLGEPFSLLVVEQEVLNGVVGDDDVEPAIFIRVDKHHPQ